MNTLTKYVITKYLLSCDVPVLLISIGSCQYMYTVLFPLKYIELNCNVMSGMMITVFVRLLHMDFVFLLKTPHLGTTFYTPNDIRTTKIPKCSIY